MLLPEFCEELYYFSNINLFEFSGQRIDSNFKNYLEKVYDYSFLETQKWLKQLNINYTIDELKYVEELYLHYNKLTKLPKLTLPNLQLLDLAYNKLTKLPKLTLPNLQRLYLSDNQLTSISNINFHNLKLLDLNNNQLTSIPNLNFPNLQGLYLRHNHLTEIPMLNHLPKLKTLNLRNNQLTEKSKTYLKSLKLNLYY